MFKTLVGSLLLSTSAVEAKDNFRSTKSVKHCKKMNIVFIVADDQGNGDIGYNTPDDQKFYTPNLDSLAGSGIKLTRAYVGMLQHN